MPDDGSEASNESELPSPDSRPEAPLQRTPKIRPAFAVIGAILCLGLVFAGINMLIDDRFGTTKSIGGIVLALSGLFSAALYVRSVRRPPAR